MKQKMISVLVAMVLLAGSAFATTTNVIYDGTALPASLLKAVTVYNDISFVTYPATAASDAYKVIAIPSNSVVLGVVWKVTTTNGPTTVLSVGDSSSTNQYITAVDGAAYTLGGNTTSKYYSAADYIKVSVSQATAGGKVRVSAVIAPIQ